MFNPQSNALHQPVIASEAFHHLAFRRRDEQRAGAAHHDAAFRLVLILGPFLGQLRLCVAKRASASQAPPRLQQPVPRRGSLR
jgi:hypothetical protein